MADQLPDLEEYLREDSYVSPFADDIRRRYKVFERRLAELVEAEGSIDGLTRGYLAFGVQREADGSTVSMTGTPLRTPTPRRIMGNGS